MWVETESVDKENAVLDYFSSFKFLDKNQKYNILTHQGGMVTVGGISESGITSKADAIEMTLIGQKFYDLLKNAPEFRFALVGVEVDGVRSYTELMEDPEFVARQKGLVIRKDIYETFEKPDQYVVFSENHLWIPYEGEKWKN